MGTAIGDIVPREAISLDSLNGKLLAFDSYNIIYQFLSSIRGQDGTPLMDSNGNVTSHLTGLFYRTISLLERGVKPVFVFDGAAQELKKDTIAKRVAIRTDAFKKQEEALKAGDFAQARKFGSRALRLEAGMVDDAKELVSLMGLPVVQALSDGEAQASMMALNGRVNGCVSQDYDALLFGAPVLYRNIGVSGKRKIPGKNVYADVEPEKIVLEKFLAENSLTQEKLIWIGILIGTDFNVKFPKIGVKTALKLVQENDSFDAIIKKASYVPEFDWREVEKIFAKPKYSDDFSMKFGRPDRDKILDFLCARHDFSADRVGSSLDKLEKILDEKSKQKTLGQWF
ncbi:MAG: flap endonuclease-1 [archaeon]|nr:flap endonuclease-1 [archaeon]